MNIETIKAWFENLSSEMKKYDELFSDDVVNMRNNLKNCVIFSLYLAVIYCFVIIGSFVDDYINGSYSCRFYAYNTIMIILIIPIAVTMLFIIIKYCYNFAKYKMSNQYDSVV